MPSLATHLTPIPFKASAHIREAIVALGRTEDISFSPDGRRLAVAGFFQDRIAVFNAHVRRDHQGPVIELTQLVEIKSDAFKRPHGVDFVDSNRIVVSNRRGGVDLFHVPERNEDLCTVQAAPVLSLPPGPDSLLNMPGSVRVGRSEPGRIEILVCNNIGDTLSRHHLDTRDLDPVDPDRNVGLRWLEHGHLLSKWLDLPDGLALSRDARWLAVSSHEGRIVLMYDLSAGLDTASEPVGILRQVLAPHGLAFSADGQRLVVADADTPNLHVYAADATGWCGVRNPVATLRVMDEETFVRGHYAPGEGGVKGVSFCGDTGILATTCHLQPMAFFDLEAICRQTEGTADPDPTAQELHLLRQRRNEEVRYELLVMSRLVKAREHTRDIVDSVSWRITKPLRDLKRMVIGLKAGDYPWKKAAP